MPDEQATDNRYFTILSEPLKVCASYKPMFGQGQKGGTSLAQFQTIYGGDSFYKWIGLDSPLMYAAHKAAGGMTSIYRQIGLGCERLFRQLLQDHLGLSPAEATWSYQVPQTTEKSRKLALDGRIEIGHIKDPAARNRVAAWTESVKNKVGLIPEAASVTKGTVFEVRQGYKSKDSKRQNADIANASNAYANLYVPVLLLLSSQIDGDLYYRYSTAKWLILTGTLEGASTDSTYVFCKDVLNYDLAGFFSRNSARIKSELEAVLDALLTAQ
ncbi:MAG: hypothetical protein HUU21_21225 [Polyangiaceae bacterium]|nr:hypothetical protein [Polyangiaceae bacterium]